MTLSEKRKKEIEEEEKYRQAVVSSIKHSNKLASQKHGAPLVLSIFIPGLGQLIKGQVKKGLWIFFGPIIAFFTILVIGFINGQYASGLLGTLWMITIILYFWQLFDAYNN